MDEELKVRVTADTKDFDQKMKQTATTATTTSKKMQSGFSGLSSKLKSCIPSMNKLQTAVKKLGNTFKSVGTKIKSFGAGIKGAIAGALTSSVGQFFALQSVINGVKNSFSSYLQSLQSASRFSYTFGKATEEATQWMDELDSKVAMNRAEMENFASTLYFMGQNMGTTSEDAMAMSKEMTALAVDLQAFTGDANSIEALAGALRGEYDSLQNYGAVLDAAAVEARALAMGLDKTSESALLMARRAILMEQFGSILGYAEGQSQTLSGQIAILKENFTKLGNAIGSVFAPLLQAVLPTLNAIVSAVTTAFNKIANVINQVFGIFGVSVGGVSTNGGVASSIASGFSDVADSIGDSAKGSKGLADSLGKSVKAAKELKRQVMGIDELNNISSQTDSGSGSGGSGGSGGDSGAGAGGIGSVNPFENAGQIESDGQKISEVAKRIAKIFEELVNAVKRFGKVASQWFGKIWNGGLKTLVGACGELLAIILELALDGVALLIDGFSTLLESPLGQWLAEVLGKGFEAIGKAIQVVNKFIKENESWFKVLAGVLVGVVVGAFVAAHGAIFGVVGIVGAVVAAIGVIYKNWDQISAFIKECADKILNAIDKAFPGLGDIIKSSMKNAWDYIKLCWDNIKIVFDTIAKVIIAIVRGDFDSIKGILSDAMNRIKENFSKAWQIVKDQMKNNFEAMKTVATTVWEGIKSAINTVLNGIKSIASTAWNAVKSTASSVWNSIQSTASSIWNGIKTTISNVLNGIKSTASSVWNGIKTTASSIWNGIKTAISNVVNGIKSACSTAWNNIKSTASSVWNGVKTAITTPINSAKSTVSNVVNGIKSSISTAFNSAKTTVSSVFNSIKSTISSTLNSAKSTVTSVVSKIKGAFNFSWSLPKLKLPHISVSGGKAPYGIGGLGSLPKFSISWYAKGGIMTNPTIFGMNGNQLLGGGEAGHEAILPLDRLWKELGKQFAQQNQMLASHGNNGTTTVVVQLDGKEIARSTVNNFKQMSQLGTLDTSWL